MSDGLHSLFPRQWVLGALPPPAIVMIYVDWLLQEMDRHAEERYPVLKMMRGHRRSEIIAFLESMPDWTAGVLNTKMGCGS